MLCLFPIFISRAKGKELGKKVVAHHISCEAVTSSCPLLSSPHLSGVVGEGDQRLVILCDRRLVLTHQLALHLLAQGGSHAHGIHSHLQLRGVLSGLGGGRSSLGGGRGGRGGTNGSDCTTEKKVRGKGARWVRTGRLRNETGEMRGRTTTCLFLSFFFFVQHSCWKVHFGACVLCEWGQARTHQCASCWSHRGERSASG